MSAAIWVWLCLKLWAFGVEIFMVTLMGAMPAPLGVMCKLTSSKWAKISKCSQDTALRDINDLVERNILMKEDAGGRSTSYVLRHC